MNAVEFIALLLTGALTLSVPVIIAGTGEIFLERTGGFNVGIEGTMLLGAISGVLAASVGGFWFGLVVGILVGLVVGALMGLATAYARGDLIIVGVAVGLIGAGLSTFVYRLIAPSGSSNLTVPTQPGLSLGPIEQIPVVGAVLADAGVLFYLAVLLAVAAWWVLGYTRFGLRLRVVGDDPDAAAARGVDPRRYRFTGAVIAGGFAGLAGAAVPLAAVGSFSPAMTGGAGFIALAVVIIARKHPLALAGGAVLFGFFNSLALLAQTRGLGLPTELYQALPYLVTIAILCIAAVARSRSRSGRVPRTRRGSVASS